MSLKIFLAYTPDHPVTLYDRRERATRMWVFHPYPSRIAYLISTLRTQQGTSYLKLILYPCSYSRDDCILIMCLHVLNLWYLVDYILIWISLYTIIVSPPLGGENLLPKVWQNYLILILTQINVNCKFKELFVCQVLQTNYYMCSLTIRKFEIPFSSC